MFSLVTKIIIKNENCYGGRIDDQGLWAQMPLFTTELPLPSILVFTLGSGVPLDNWDDWHLAKKGEDFPSYLHHLSPRKRIRAVRESGIRNHINFHFLIGINN